jgi:glycosyltransferase involved in cell wall biosynthesis
MSAAQEPWLTIITIVRNDPEGFRRTIESIAAQELGDVQVLVVDGSENRAQIQEAIQPAGVEVDYVWEAPKGIYPAMNSGLARARGTYSMFTNAGDVLHSPKVVADLRGQLQKLEVPWGYGQVRFINPDGTSTLPEPFDYASEQKRCFSGGRFPPHQGTFARTELLRDLGGFDSKYRICADYALFLKLSQVSNPLEIDAVISDFYVGGLSTIAWKESLKEFHDARVSILKPSGIEALRECLGTWSQFARMNAARTLKR